MTCLATIERLPCDRCKEPRPHAQVQIICQGCGKCLCAKCFGDSDYWCKECLEKEKAEIAKGVRKES